MSVDVNRFREPVKDFSSDLGAALVYPFETIPRIIAVLAIAILTFLSLFISVAPRYMIDLIINGYAMFGFKMTLDVVLAEGGWLYIGILGVYGIMTGIGAVNMIAQIRTVGIRGLSSLGGLLPVVAVSGCASCGVGVLALLGFGGALLALPFNGQLIRIAGIGLFLLFLGYAGDPRECRIP